MDIATLVGIVSAFGLVILAIMTGGGLALFISPASLMIVVGGTLGATMINYPLREVLGSMAVAKNVFFAKLQSSKEMSKLFMDFAGKARKEGLLALENDVNNVEDAFVKKGLQLSVDGLEPDAIQDILETEIEFLQERHRLGSEIFATMGAFAPALGMIGTLIGLVQMLQSMDDPSSIGPSMAVALLTTFYGSVIANMICIPISGKLKTRSKEETLVKELVITGVLGLAKGDNPRILEQKMLAYMPPREREGDD
ncbi:MAG: MotA/TolQ/ExbB proton channel family protein [Thermodesulfobacteriota bacterium]|nr:MotA/TolQ/ExbB proton channel family protein [Thermodesulfobacteriota bacterium]